MVLFDVRLANLPGMHVIWGLQFVNSRGNFATDLKRQLVWQLCEGLSLA